MTVPLANKWKESPLRRHWGLFFVVCAAAYLLFAHPDVIETANHSYLLLESIFSGRFTQFYNDVMAHQNPLYYINNAHYNIFIYLIFALAELPVFLFNAIFGTAVCEPVLYFIAKLVSALFFFGCIYLLWRVAALLGLSEADSRNTALFFALSPAAFFSVMVMGQYDSICLFFLLLGLFFWLRGDMLPCALWFGVGAACKFFPLLLFVPLVLLTEKRVGRIALYGVLSLWLVAPTTLLFHGRNGDMGLFNDIMVSRLFSAKIPAAGDIPIFPLLYVVICFVAYLWKPPAKQRGQSGIWLCLAVLGSLFLFVQWHPQWVILLVPFLALTTFMERRRTPWFWLNMVMSAGFFLYCAMTHARQLEANLLDFGLVGLLSGLKTSAVPNFNTVSFYLLLLPVVAALPMVLFGGGLAAHVLLKIPGAQGTPASRLAVGAAGPRPRLVPYFAWLCFVVGMGIWFVPTVFTWLKCFSFI